MMYIWEKIRMKEGLAHGDMTKQTYDLEENP